MQTTVGNSSPLRGGPEPSIDPSFGREGLEVFERLSTKTRAGAAISVPADYGLGEAIELRYSSALSNTQFQGLFMQVDTSVANTSTVRGAEISARNASGISVGLVEGFNGHANQKGTTGTLDAVFGITGEVGQDSTVTGTATLLAAVRGKVQAEDGATITKGYCFLAEHENVTGNKTITAAYGAKSGAGEAFTALIDASDATLAETDTGTVVRLITFKGANGTTYHLIHDTDAATVVAVGT